MDNEASRHDAATGQQVRETLDMLYATARRFSDRDQNLAAPALAAEFLELVEPRVLANSLANVLLHHVRVADAEAALGSAVVIRDEAHAVDQLRYMINLGRSDELADDIGPGSTMAKYVQRASITDIGRPIDPAIRSTIKMPAKPIDLSTPTDFKIGDMTYVARRTNPDVRGLVVGFPDSEPWALIAWGDASKLTPQYAAAEAVRENHTDLVRWENRREADPASCRFCGCTEDYACPGGCAWATDDQIRQTGLEPMDGDVCTTCVALATAVKDARYIGFDEALDGVEVRLIGPEPALIAVQEAMRAAGIPLVGESELVRARDRGAGAFRYYAATDPATADKRDRRRTRRAGRSNRGGSRSWQNRDEQGPEQEGQ